MLFRSDRAEVTLVGFHSTAVMTGPQQSFASVKKRYEDAFLKCQTHAKKLPLTELDYAEARRILPLLPPLVEAAKPHIPDVSGEEPGSQAIQLYDTITKFIRDANDAFDGLSKEVNDLRPPQPQRVRATTDPTSVRVRSWRKNLRTKVDDAKKALQELDLAINSHTDSQSIPRARVQYYQHQLDRYRIFLEKDIPSAVAKIEEAAGASMTEDDYDELLDFENQVKPLLDTALNSLTQADIQIGRAHV